MDQATSRALIARIHANLAAGRREEGTAEYCTPVSQYLDDGRHARERDLLFGRHPIVFCHGREMAEPGDFVAHDLAGRPILATRLRDGSVRAFLNVCRHRGATVVTEGCGSRRRAFVCPYHGWTYDQEGRLSGVGDKAAFAGLDPAGHGLVRLAAAERFGLVWIRPEPPADGRFDLDVDAFLGPQIASDFAAYGLDGTHPYGLSLLPGEMDWKVMVDTFLEDYHFRFVHGQSVYRFYLDDASLYERFGPHIRFVIPKRTIRDLEGTDPAGWRLRDHANILYLLFPNTVMVFVADHAAVFAMFPQGRGRSVMRLLFCLDRPADEGRGEAYWAKNANLIRTALQEDFVVAEGVQKGFASGANTHLTFGRYEKGLAFFHQALDEALAE